MELGHFSILCTAVENNIILKRSRPYEYFQGKKKLKISPLVRDSTL